MAKANLLGTVYIRFSGMGETNAIKITTDGVVNEFTQETETSKEEYQTYGSFMKGEIITGKKHSFTLGTQMQNEEPLMQKLIQLKNSNIPMEHICDIWLINEIEAEKPIADQVAYYYPQSTISCEIFGWGEAGTPSVTSSSGTLCGGKPIKSIPTVPLASIPVAVALEE